jgi:hypothetical protein
MVAAGSPSQVRKRSSEASARTAGTAIGSPSSRAALISAIAIAIGGCIVNAKPLPLGGPHEVGPDEGLLLLETESNSEIEELTLAALDAFGSRQHFTNLPPGRKYHLFALPEGEYRWHRLQLPSNIVFNRRTIPIRWDLGSLEDTQISVRAGYLNYSGAFYLHRWSPTSLSFRSLNRSGEALVWLKSKFPRLISDYPTRYGGPGRDDFLDFYHGELRLLGTDADPKPEEDALAPASP